MTEPGRHAADRGDDSAQDDSAQDDSAQDGVQEEAVRNDAVDEPLPPVAAPTAPADVAAPATGETPILASVDLVAGYIPGVNILNGCNVHVNKGELVGIIGPNGAGKSTLIKAMFGLVPVRGGAVMLGEDNISALPAHTLVGRGLGYVPQNNNVFPSLTIEENLQMGLYLRPKEYRTRYQVITEMFPVLHERRTQKCGSLSGGERQVVAMGRALMTDPTVLFLDEPSAGLSPLMQDSVFASIKTINESGVSILMVEQNARSCLEISHRGYVLDQGKDAYTGTGRDLLNDPKVIELYLGTLARVAQ